MKHKICISIDEGTLLKVKEAIRNRKFRNKSHAFEAAVNEVIGG
jgi:metal-responsive CopG/Arc/MetJ family transcriptional regulator